MKKSFLFSLMFTLMLAMQSYAQNDYNMVIELANGTKITLGPDELKNITFSNGVISITGNTIDELNTKINNLSSAFISLYTDTREMETTLKNAIFSNLSDKASKADLDALRGDLKVALLDYATVKALYDLRVEVNGKASATELAEIRDALKNFATTDIYKDVYDFATALDQLAVTVGTQNAALDNLLKEVNGKASTQEVAEIRDTLKNCATTDVYQTIAALQAAVSELQSEIAALKNNK